MKANVFCLWTPSHFFAITAQRVNAETADKPALFMSTVGDCGNMLAGKVITRKFLVEHRQELPATVQVCASVLMSEIHSSILISLLIKTN